MPGFDITEEPTYTLSVPIATAYAPTDAAWDCAVAGLPFNFAMDKDRPLARETAPFRRERIDQEREPSENSLDSGLWLRSFTSMHYGAGQKFAEPLEILGGFSTLAASSARFRFNTGANVDPWTIGEVTIGKDSNLLRSSAATSQTTLGIGSGTVLHATDATLNQVTSGGAVTAVTWGGAGTITALTTDGTNYYAADATGIYKGALPTGAGALAWNTGSQTVTRFVKSRLMAGIGASIYELVGGAPPALPAALYTHPNSSFRWTDFAEGPNGIYVAGFAGEQSYIYRISVTASGSTITLGAPIIVADMPRGEIVRTIYGYLGTYLAIGTSLGIRVATFNPDGSLEVGPIIVSTAGGAYDFVGYDRFLYASGGTDTLGLDASTGPGIYRIDLSVDIDKLRFAYAQESTWTGASAVSGVTISGGYVVYTVPGTGLVQVHATNYETDAWIVYGKVTLATTESKAWRSLLVRANAPAGTTVEVHASTTGSGNPSTWTILGTLGGTAADAEFSLASPAPAPTRELYVALRLTGTTTSRPTVTGVTIRAVPAPKRSRYVQVPLMCFDHEKDRNNLPRGYVGGAWARLSALEDLEDAGTIITWQDFTTGERRSAIIEKVAMTRVSPPSRNNANAGGVITLTLRLV